MKVIIKLINKTNGFQVIPVQAFVVFLSKIIFQKFTASAFGNEKVEDRGKKKIFCVN